MQRWCRTRQTVDMQLRRPPRMPHNAARISLPRPECGLVLEDLNLECLFYIASFAPRLLLVRTFSRLILSCGIARLPAGIHWHTEIECDGEHILVRVNMA